MRKDDLLNFAKYLYENHPGINSQVPFWKVLSVIDKNPDKIIFINERGYFKGGAVFLEINDDQVLRLMRGDLRIDNTDDINILINSEGKNIHFMYVVADGISTILKGLKRIIREKKPNSIMWFNKNLDLKILRYRSA